MKTVKQMIQETDIGEAFYQATFGIEKEGLRVTSTGELALTAHPLEFGNRSFHPYIQTDYSESQLELITPPLRTIKESYDWLAALHDVVLQTIPSDEAIWPISMPMVLPDESVIPIAKLDNKDDVTYREILTEKYGNDHNKIRKMAIIADGQIRMAFLAIVGSHSVNGVAALHTEILKEDTLKDFYAQRGKLKMVDNQPSIEATTEVIKAALGI